MIRTLTIIATILVFGLLLDIEAAPPISQPRTPSTVHIRVVQTPAIVIVEPE